MGRIYMLLGKSGCGKDSIKQQVTQLCSYIAPIVPYTTRSKRANEVDGVQYYFKNERFFTEALLKGNIIEHRTYSKIDGDVTYYTCKDEQFDRLQTTDCIVIGTLDVYKSYVKYFGKDMVVPIYIHVPEMERLERSIRREKCEVKPQVIEICRRLVDDNREFSYEELSKVDNLIIIENVNLLEAAKGVISIITGMPMRNYFTIKDVSEDYLLYG